MKKMCVLVVMIFSVGAALYAGSTGPAQSNLATYEKRVNSLYSQIESAIDAGFSDAKDSLLWTAAYYHWNEFVTKLLKNGANPNSVDKKGVSVVQAVFENAEEDPIVQLDTLQIILDSGAVMPETLSRKKPHKYFKAQSVLDRVKTMYTQARLGKSEKLASKALGLIEQMEGMINAPTPLFIELLMPAEPAGEQELEETSSV